MKIKITPAIWYVINQQILCVAHGMVLPQWTPMLNTVGNSADPSQSSDVSLWNMPGCPWPLQCQGLMVGVAIGAKFCALKEHGCPPADSEHYPPFPSPSDYA